MVLVGREGIMQRHIWDGQDVSGQGGRRKLEGGGVSHKMKTGPYGVEGFWSDESVSALQKQGETETKQKH